MKQVNYSGEFMSIGGVRWRVDILTDTPGARKELEFDLDSLIIEWAEESKEVPVCGSTATINVVSPGDRTYSELYTENPTGVLMKVYRKNMLYWSGYLDTEFYEEPYASNEGYTVSLTFSDFGVLDRLKFSGEGKRSLANIIDNALSKSGLPRTLNTSLISGNAEGTALMDLEVDSSNFFDEDGEALTLREVLEGILQPLALRIVQRAGAIWIYDLNGLATSTDRRVISWESTDQQMSVDKVYNNAKVTWSPYVAKKFGPTKDCWTQTTEFTKAQATQALNASPVLLQDTYSTYLYAYHFTPSADAWEDKEDLGFAMLISGRGAGATINEGAIPASSGNRGFYKIIPIEDGSESEGVAISYPYVVEYKEGVVSKIMGGGYTQDKDGAPGPSIVVFDSAHIPPIPHDRFGDLNLRVEVNMLCDTRYNPYETPVDDGVIRSDKTTYELAKSDANFVYVPVKIKFRPTGSANVYVWSNRAELNNIDKLMVSLSETRGKWYADDGSTFGYLAWYDPRDRINNTGVLGWQKNKPAIQAQLHQLYSNLESADPGQIIPWPFGAESGGEIWMEILEGPWITKTSPGIIAAEYRSYEASLLANSWRLLEPPEFTAISTQLITKELPDEDLEYSGMLNTNAKESIEIDTICGTSDKRVYLSRGAYTHPCGEYVRTITRGGITGQAEDVLIGTLYSQFGSRKLKLSGTAAMNGEGVCLYTDEASEGVNLMLAGAVENAREDTMSGTFIEVSPDIYTGIHI